jgi:hypothetical protein
MSIYRPLQMFGKGGKNVTTFIDFLGKKNSKVNHKKNSDKSEFFKMNYLVDGRYSMAGGSSAEPASVFI